VAVVDPVDTELERPVDGCDRVVVLLRVPAELPATAADRPSAEPEARDLHAGGPEHAPLELRLQHRRLPTERSHGSIVPEQADAVVVRGVHLRHTTGGAHARRCGPGAPRSTHAVALRSAGRTRVRPSTRSSRRSSACPSWPRKPAPRSSIRGTSLRSEGQSRLDRDSRGQSSIHPRLRSLLVAADAADFPGLARVSPRGPGRVSRRPRSARRRAPGSRRRGPRTRAPCRRDGPSSRSSSRRTR